MNVRNTIEDALFRIYRIIGRNLIRYSSNPRPDSAPYITGDGFRGLAQHIYDATQTELDPSLVSEGDIVFVGDSMIDKFLIEIHPKISHNYILITHNGDAKITKELFERASDKIIRWYGINVEFDHPRLTPIPLGIENKHYYVCGIPTIFNFVRKRAIEKLNKIFYAFTVSTNPTERGAALAEMERHPEGVTLSAWRGFFPYLLELHNYKFVLSPPGSCEEGHRTWDTMYIGGIPIVKGSITTRYFKRMGVPLLLIQDWSELDKLTADTMSSVYEDLLKDSNLDTLTFDYWKKKIMQNEA